MLHLATKNIQKSLASYCKNPINNSLDKDIAGIRYDRLHHYRRLVFNVVMEGMNNAYPITKSILKDTEWHQLVDIFFSKHDCKTAEYWKLPYELYTFFSKNAELQERYREYPFLKDLLYFEWIEIKLFCQKENENKKYIPVKNIEMNDTLVLNPDSEIISTEYPFHRQRHTWVKEKKNYFLLAFRNKQSFEVSFLEISPILLLLYEMIKLNDIKIINCMNILCQDPLLEKKVAKSDILSFLKVLLDKGAILGISK